MSDAIEAFEKAYNKVFAGQIANTSHINDCELLWQAALKSQAEREKKLVEFVLENSLDYWGISESGRAESVDVVVDKIIAEFNKAQE